jgi:hypothetical protein
MNTIKTHLWKVEYNYIFCLSRRTEKYKKERRNVQGYFLTEEPNIDNVFVEINQSLDNQSKVSGLISALYLGTIQNNTIEIKK